MVHALEAIHRLLKPDGILVDIRPYAEPSLVKVMHQHQVLFAVPKRETDPESVIDSDKAMDEALGRELFTVDRAGDFEFFSYGSNAAEIREFWDRYNDYSSTPKEQERIDYEEKIFSEAEKIRKRAAEGAEVVVHERVRIARLKPVRRDE